MDRNEQAGAREETVHIFVSYAREDGRWMDPGNRYNLVPYLAESLRRHNATFWFDKKLVGGDEFRRHIEAEIDHSQIALLIVSQNFLNSEFIETHEMPRIAERTQQGKMIVVPVLVEPCAWNDYPFLADRQMVPSAEPLIDYTESEPKWARVKFQILDQIKTQLKRLREAQQPAVDENGKPEAPKPAAAPEPRATYDVPRLAETTPVVAPAERPHIPEPIGIGPVARIEPLEDGVTRKPGEWRASGGTVTRSRKIPVWAWGGGVAAVLLLGVVFVGVQTMSHSGEPAPQSGGAAAPENQTPDQPAAQPSSEPAATPAEAPSGDTAPVHRGFNPGEHPATTAPQAAAGNGESLADTMKFIQNTLNGIGEVSFVISQRDASNGSTPQISVALEASNVVGDPNQCRLTYYWTQWWNGSTRPTYNHDGLLSLRDVESVTVEPAQKYMTDANADKGNPNLVVLSTNPSVTAVVANGAKNQHQMLPFTDAGPANRVAQAIRHAVALCGGKVN